MPLIGISSVQPSLQIHLGTLRAGIVIDSKALGSSYIFRSGKRLLSSWKSVDLHSKLCGDVGSFEIRRGRIFITGVATFETEGLVPKRDVKKGNENSQLDNDSSSMQLESANKESEEVDDKERLRRMKISKANKGITPWNKGRKHSAETCQQIREKTRIAMQNSKVKMKLANYGGHAQSDETKEKIAAAARRWWERRSEVLKLQEFCHFEWQNLIAEASRIGFGGEELQWDSYEILNEELHKEWLESVERRKKMKPKGCKRAPKTLEQRRKISMAVSAKWTDPEYRERISAAKSRNRGTTVGVEKKPQVKQGSNTQSRVRNHPEKKASVSQNYNGSETKRKTQQVKKRNTKYKDPLASSKLETIKNIRAQREATESMKIEAIERARLLIAEAEMAMNALELAAEKSPIAQASLVETRKIIAEAIQSLESLQTRQAKNEKNGEERSDAPSHVREDMASSQGKSSDYSEVSVQDIVLIDDGELVSSGSQVTVQDAMQQDIVVNDDGKLVFSGSQVNEEDAMQHSCASPAEQLVPNGNVSIMFENDGTAPKSSTKTKKWVRGRLIEVSEEAEHWSLSEEEKVPRVEDVSLSDDKIHYEDDGTGEY